MWWVEDPSKAMEDLDEGMRIYMLLRVTYGDVAASTQLELAIRRIIAPSFKTKLGKAILAGDRYVDDLLPSHDDKNMLLEALNDIEETLMNHGFMIKRIISNGLWYHAHKGLLKDKDTSLDGAFTDDEVSETTFGHEYNWQQDTLKLNLSLNVNSKSRGISQGPDLDETDISTVKISKTVLARLCGQCYQISGAFLDPILIAFKIYFSQSCKILSGWNEICTDEEFVTSFKDFLTIIKASYKSLKTWPRMLISPNYWIKRIICHTDGSLTAASYVFFLISEYHIQAYSINVDAGSRIKSHSVPCNECSGLVLGVEAVMSFIMNHYEDISSKIKNTLTVSFQIDYSGLASWLSPYHIHKNVFV